MKLSAEEVDELHVNLDKVYNEALSKTPKHLVKPFASLFLYVKRVSFDVPTEMFLVYDSKKRREMEGLEIKIRTLEADLLKVRGLINKLNKPAIKPPAPKKRKKRNGYR